MIAVAAVVYAYCTVWLLITPFQEADFIAWLFPPRQLALSFVSLFLVVLMLIGGMFAGVVLTMELFRGEKDGKKTTSHGPARGKGSRDARVLPKAAAGHADTDRTNSKT